MSINTIRSTLETTLYNWASAQSPAIPIAFENVGFVKPSSGNFLECWLLPAATLAPTVEATRRREIGIFQINIWTPQDVGSKAAMDIAQSIAALYPMVPKNGNVSIEKPVTIEKAILDNSGWYVVPVLVHYRLET